MFLEAWWSVLGARLAMTLSGDKTLANLKIAEANAIIMEARKADANEGLTVNNVTPDWIRARGIFYNNWEYSPGSMTFEWGPLLGAY